MEDYIEYLDFKSLSLGDELFEAGKYAEAKEAYEKAYDLLYKYNGDSMVAIEMGADLNKKIKLCESQI